MAEDFLVKRQSLISPKSSKTPEKGFRQSRFSKMGVLWIKKVLIDKYLNIRSQYFYYIQLNARIFFPKGKEFRGRLLNIQKGRKTSFCGFHLLRDLSCFLFDLESDLELLLDELELDDDELELELRLLLLLRGEPCFRRLTSLIGTLFSFCSASFLCLYWTSLLMKVDIILSAS